MATAHAVSSDIKFDREGLRKHCFTLTKCQLPFVRLVAEWIRNPRKMLVVVSGGPGTGKSYVVKNTMNCIKVSQVRMSFTARSAQSIGGRTIHSVMRLDPFGDYKQLEESLKDEIDVSKCIEQSGKILLDCFKCDQYPRVVILDEVAMINGWLTYWLIRYFMDRTDLPLLFVCMGDPHQLTPINSYCNMFSIDFAKRCRRVVEKEGGKEDDEKVEKEQFEFYEIHLTESKRFVPEYEGIINTLRKFIDEGEDNETIFDFIREKFPVVDDIDRTHLMQADRAMAFTKEMVKKWNSFYLKNKVSGPLIRIDNDLILKAGCIVFVTKNRCSSATNGTRLIFDRYEKMKDLVVCRDPVTGEEITVLRSSPENKFPIELGFSGTVHKYQGDTIDENKIVICFGKQTDLNFIYTALSRVRQMEQILAVCF